MSKVIELPVLIKLSKLEYLNKIQNGELYMNNLKYFVDLEKSTGKQGIGDISEASQIIINKHKLFVQFDGEDEVEVPLSSPPGIVYDNKSLLHPVFCLMYKSINLTNKIDSKYIGQLKFNENELLDFVSDNNDVGALIIIDIEEFLRRVHHATERRLMGGRYGLIKYRDKRLPEISGFGFLLDDTFTKDIRFEKQSEFRIELFTCSETSFVLNIGDIRDISFVTKPEKLRDEIVINCTKYYDE